MSTPRSLSRAETSALLTYTKREDPTIYTATLLLTLTGLRIGEFLHLHWRDMVGLNYEARPLLEIRAEWTKTKQPRSIPIPRALQEHLKNYVARIDSKEGKPPMLHWPLWPGDKEKPYTTRYLQECIRRAGWAACQRRVTPHMLRHTYATGLLRVSNTRIVQIALGHQSLRSTQIYTHPAAEEIQNATDRLYDALIQQEEDL